MTDSLRLAGATKADGSYVFPATTGVRKKTKCPGAQYLSSHNWPCKNGMLQWKPNDHRKPGGEIPCPNKWHQGPGWTAVTDVWVWWRAVESIIRETIHATMPDFITHWRGQWLKVGDSQVAFWTVLTRAAEAQEGWQLMEVEDK